MRGLLGYLSRSSLSSGMAFANSFRARRSAPLSAMRGYCSVLRCSFFVLRSPFFETGNEERGTRNEERRTLVLDPLQFEFCGCCRRRVWIFADAFLERLAGHADIA